MAGSRSLSTLEPEVLGPGRVLVRHQLANARLRVPIIRAVYPPGPPRLEWSEIDSRNSEHEVGSLLMDLRRLSRAGAPDKEIIELARRYGPLRVGRSGVPGTFSPSAALTGKDRYWEDSQAQTGWADQILGLTDPSSLSDEGDFSSEEPTSEDLDYLFEDREPAQWEPLAAWRAYSRVLSTVLGIAGDLEAEREVPLVRFADTWSPATGQLSPLGSWSKPGEPPSRPDPFDITDPRSWDVPEFAHEWWWELEESLDTSEARTTAARRALSWILNCLADSAGLRTYQVWAEDSQYASESAALSRMNSDTRYIPTYVLAPDPQVTFPTDWPAYPSEISWSVWSVVVSQLHAAVMSKRGWIECDSCGLTFPIEEGHRHPHSGDPAYCGEDCRRVGNAARRAERERKKSRTSETTAVLTAVPAQTS